MKSLFVEGLIVGFCLAAPVGPIAVLCVQRTMARGKLAGFISGFGAAAADALYGMLAALGVTFVSEFLMAHRLVFQRAGGAILCALGLRLLFAKVAERDPAPKGGGLAGYFFSTFLLTLTNPMTFVAFAAIFATLGVGVVRGHNLLTLELAGGVLVGSGLWWTFIVALVDLFRDRFRYQTLVWINRGTGIFVIGVGILYLFVLRPEQEPPKILRRELRPLTGRLTPTPR